MIKGIFLHLIITIHTLSGSNGTIPLLTDITCLFYRREKCYQSAIPDAFPYKIPVHRVNGKLETNFVIKTVDDFIAGHGNSLDNRTIVHSNQSGHICYIITSEEIMPEKNPLSKYGEITYQHTQKQKDALYVPLPIWLTGKTAALLSDQNIHLLYHHQRKAIEAVYNGENVVISTGTSSGKSLCYQIPLIEMLLSDEKSTAILVFPTKALTQDQYRSLLQLIPEKADQIAVYDGDTPRNHRSLIRARARIILTNPDMLHAGVLPYHTGWSSFLSNLKWVVFDEIHIYKGVFGAHVANVIRRLKRAGRHYRAEPRFIFCSATLSNGKALAEKMTGEPFISITDDTSGNGTRDIIFLNPPVINEELQLRAGAIVTASKAAQYLLETNRQILLFCQSRQSVEFTVRRLRDYKVDASGYRSGYLARERRSIESGLKSGETRCIAATNALELGMDIGGIDAVISIGYPGSISAMMQRQGRAGRKNGDSRFILVGSQTPTDQYIINHPDFLFEKEYEPVLIDPDNLLILLQHLQCSLYEIPFSSRESYGNLTVEETQDLLNYFAAQGIARFAGDHFYWLDSGLPQATVSLRSAGLNRIGIMSSESGKPELIGEVDQSSAYWMVHPGAIYYHNGVSYLIEELDLQNNTASAKRFIAPYSTQAQKQSHISVNEILSSAEKGESDVHTANVTVKTQVVSYKKTDNETHRTLEIIPLEMPEEVLETKAFIIVLKESFRNELRDSLQWNSDKNDYGPDWPRIRRSVIERDNHECTLCHTRGDVSLLHVHHIQPYRSFPEKSKANDLNNLVTLCPDCHHRVEQSVQMRSGLAGFANAFHQLAALFIECDPGDISISIEPDCPDFDGRPAIFLFENTPGGIGLSEAIAERCTEINTAVTELIRSCPCQDGCPGCVGAAGENGIGGKAEALAICRGIGEAPHE